MQPGDPGRYALLTEYDAVLSFLGFSGRHGLVCEIDPLLQN